MFCYQCQEAAKNIGCAVRGVCGKEEDTSNLQDLLIFVLKGIAVYGEKLEKMGVTDKEISQFINQGLFATITNGNFDNDRFIGMIAEALQHRNVMKIKFDKLYKDINRQGF